MPIEQILRHYLNLELIGQRGLLVALCPWHEDMRPSLVVNPDGGIWKCWVCELQGDALDFVSKYCGVTRVEAQAICRKLWPFQF
jgi:DNA primase